MRNKGIQSNLPFVAPSDEVADQEFASGEKQDNVVSDDPPKSQHHDAFHTDLDKEHSDEFMFNDDSASICAPPLFSSLHLPTNPSSSKPVYDYGLSSSFSEPVEGEIKIYDQTQMHLGGETESIPPKPDNRATTTQHGRSEQLVNQEGDKAKYRTST